MMEENLGGTRILIVDDEPAHIEVITRILKERGYRHFQSATASAEALPLYRQFQPDLIILDWFMPHLSGGEVLKQLRQAIPAATYLPILVVTASPQIEVTREALANGATDFLQKPYDPAEIVLRVHNLARTRLMHHRLEEKERRYSALFATVRDAIAIADDDRRYIDVNPAFCDLLGYSREELLERTIADVTPRDNQDTDLHRWKKFLARGVESAEFTLLRKDGGQVEVEFTSVAHFLPGMHLSVMREITERKRAEEERLQQALALLESNARVQSMLESALDAVIAIDHRGVLLEFNAAAERIFGYKRAEVIGREMAEMIIPARQRERLRNALAEFLITGENPALGQRTELSAMRRDGTEFPAELAIVQMPLEGLPLFTGYLRDITDRKQFVAALEEGRERLRQVLDTLPAATYTCDADGLITYFNERAAALWGRVPKLRDPEDRFCGSFKLYEPGGKPVAPEEGWTAMAVRHGLVETGREVMVEREDGTRLFALAYATPQMDAAGKPVGAVTVLVDITERRRTETALEEAKTEADLANRAKSEFLSRMSHELRTPLNAILGFAQVLEMANLQGQPRDCVWQILKAGQHLLTLINEVLDLSGIEAGRVTFSIEPVRVLDVVRECVDLVRPLADARQLRLSAPLHDSLDVYALADRQRLKQVALNLLANAVKYNRPGGSVNVSWQAQGAGELRIHIEDTGHGIPSEKLGRLFSPFDRLGADHSDIEGSGLGLALSKKLIKAMGGDIGVQSIHGSGSVFWVELPLSGNPLTQIQKTSAANPVTPPALAGTLLYIEDNLSNLKLIEYILARFPGIKLLAAMQGGLGVDLAREHRPDLILLDLHLPDIMGDEVLARLRADPATKAIPIAILTADATANQEKRLFAAGADEFLTKPIDVARLMEVIQSRLLKRGEVSPPHHG